MKTDIKRRDNTAQNNNNNNNTKQKKEAKLIVERIYVHINKYIQEIQLPSQCAKNLFYRRRRRNRNFIDKNLRDCTT